MKYRLLNILFLTLFLSTASFGADAKVIQVDRPELRSDIPDFVGYVPDEIVVKFKPAAVAKVEKRQLASGILGIASVDQINQKYSATAVSEMFPNAKPVAVNVRVIDLSGYYKIRFSQNYDDIEKVVAEYQTLPEVEKAEAIGIHTVHATPNDGNYASQWHLNQSNDHDVDAPEAWDVEDGSSQIIVGVLDTGVRYFHKDLGGSAASYTTPEAADGNMWINDDEKNGVAGVDDDGNGYVDDWIGWDFVDDAGDTRTPVWTGEDGDVPDNDPRDFNGHGTHCAGNVAAINNNGYATAAVSGGWGGNGNGVKVMALRMGYSAKYLRRYEVGLVRMDYAAQAFYYAADNGAHIVSCSWGSSNSGGIEDAIDYFVAQGGLVFNSAGNDGTTTASYVAGRSDVVAVASSDQNDCKSDFSNYGTWVDISSPGTAIMSLYHSHDDAANDYVATLDGTSMACPIAASVAALIWSQNRSWSANDVLQRLYDTADDIYAESCNSSYSGQLGAGRVNAFAAVNGGGTPGDPPVAEFSGTPTSGTAPLTVNFTDQSTNTPTSWSWNFGDGGTSTAQNPSHQYTAAGVYTVTLTATNAYGSDGETKTNYITVGQPPVAAFTGTPTSGTAPLTVNFTDQSTNTPTSWSWNFGDGGTSTVQNPSHQYTAAGVYTVTLTATNAYGSDGETKTNYITVTAPGQAPVAAFTGTPTSGTAPLTVNFTDQSTNTPTSWSWNFGDGGTSTVQNPSHQYTAAGVYTVTLTATNAYGSDGETKTNYITVTAPGQPPVAAFVGTPTSGTAPLTVNFTDQSTNTPTSWSWNFGDGGTSTSQNPSHQYTAAGVYTVTLTATNAYGSDGETKTNYITVTAPGQPPVAAFVGTPTSGTTPLTVNFTDQSTNTPTSWSWNFGDGGTSTSQNPSHQYTAAGVYTVTLTATNAFGSDGETKTNYITANAPAQNLMHVNAIQVTKEKWFALYRGKARVRVVDAAGNPVASASVTGNWSGGATTSATFTTGTDGWGTTYAAWRWGDASYTFCVSNITKTGWTYDASANEVSCGSTNNMIEAAATTSKIRLDEMDEELKSKLAFSYPNPFNATTVISFYVPEDKQVTVEIFNVLGEKITTLVNQHLETGVHSINWHSTNDAGTLVGSGTYFFKVNIGNDYTMMRKMILLK